MIFRIDFFCGTESIMLSENFTKHFISLIDPRKNNHNKRHKLCDILIITILAVICGADDWVAVVLFAKGKKKFLKKFLELPNGIPSHDTIDDLFSRISIEELESCFTSWINSLIQIKNGDIIPIDGKTLRRSHDKKNSKSAIHMISAWSTKNQVVLGQYKVNEKSNEITAIPELLKMLDISGCTVTIDAIGCHTKIAAQIINQGGDYVLSLKENQGNFYHAAINLFERMVDTAEDISDMQQENILLDETHEEKNIFSSGDIDLLKQADILYPQLSNETTDKAHGRIEKRKCTVLLAEYLPEFEKKWEGLKSIVRIESSRQLNNKTSLEKRYYITSHLPDAEKIALAIREHWCVENQSHWCLNVSFREDDCRVRKGNAAGNFAIIRHIATNALKKETTAKVGIKNKRHKAGWSDEYLAKIVEAIQT